MHYNNINFKADPIFTYVRGVPCILVDGKLDEKILCITSLLDKFEEKYGHNGAIQMVKERIQIIHPQLYEYVIETEALIEHWEGLFILTAVLMVSSSHVACDNEDTSCWTNNLISGVTDSLGLKEIEEIYYKLCKEDITRILAILAVITMTDIGLWRISNSLEKQISINNHLLKSNTDKHQHCAYNICYKLILLDSVLTLFKYDRPIIMDTRIISIGIGNPSMIAELLTSVCKHKKASLKKLSLAADVNNKKIGPNFTLILILSILLDTRAVSYGYCQCASTEYGKKLNEIYTNKEMKIFYQYLKCAKYGEAINPVSHAWGDGAMAMIAYARRKDFPQFLWLDAAQNEKFDAIKCRKEYENREVYCISTFSLILESSPWIAKIIKRWGETFGIAQLTASILVSSEWGHRGWIAQEFSAASTLNLWPLLSKCSKDDMDISFKEAMGWLKTEKHNALRTIIRRIWRQLEDISISSEWWSIEAGIDKMQALGIIATGGIQSYSEILIQPILMSKGYCWLIADDVVNTWEQVKSVKIKNGIMRLTVIAQLITISRINDRFIGTQHCPFLYQAATVDGFQKWNKVERALIVKEVNRNLYIATPLGRGSSKIWHVCGPRLMVIPAAESTEILHKLTYITLGAK